MDVAIKHLILSGKMGQKILLLVGLDHSFPGSKSGVSEGSLVQELAENDCSAKCVFVDPHKNVSFFVSERCMSTLEN